MSQYKIKRKPTFNRKIQLGKITNDDGSHKLSRISPHHQALVTGEEFVEHMKHLPDDTTLVTDAGCRFSRYHFATEEEAERCLAALKAEGGFGVRFKKSIRLMGHWEGALLTLLPNFQTGTIQPDDSTLPYDNPKEHEEELW